METKQTDLVIVGAGTAGMTAAIYALRAGRKVILLEALAYGGQIICISQQRKHRMSTRKLTSAGTLR